MAVLCTCKRMKQLCERPELWRRVVFDSADEQRGLKAERLLSVLGRARGGVEVLQLARCVFLGGGVVTCVCVFQRGVFKR
jgi:hypothetical protein